MKKIRITIPALLAAIAAGAQTTDQTREAEMKWSAFHFFLTLLTFVFFAMAILYFIRLILDDRIKNKLVEKGAPANLVAQLLQPAVKDTKNIIIKWVCILGSSGIGLLLVDYFQPLGIHSLAIMSLSLAVGFLLYFFYIRRSEKKNEHLAS